MRRAGMAAATMDRTLKSDLLELAAAVAMLVWYASALCILREAVLQGHIWMTEKIDDRKNPNEARNEQGRFGRH
jgi:hypothetical protein